MLLAILLVAAAGTWLDRWLTAKWDRSLVVGVYPIAADASPATRSYIDGLDPAQFKSIDAFFAREAKRHGIAVDRPLQVRLLPAVREAPPKLAPDSGPLAAMWWSLRTRWYAWRAAGDHPSQIRIFVLYHDPEVTQRVPHSLGLQKGLIGVVYAYAAEDMDGANNIVIAHELMHTLGAGDKYDLATTLPSFPDGYGDPQASPRYPQDTAEIMAGRRAVSTSTAEMPRDLDEVVVGDATAREIAWRRN
jgi:hypothetical protein